MATVPPSFDVQRCLSAMDDIETDLSNLLAGLSEVQFQASPPSGGWPIGYCIEHLALTGNSFLGLWDAAIGGAKPVDCAERAKQGYSWWERRILGFFEPPYRLKTKTSRPFVPCNHRPMSEVVRRFLATHKEIAARLEASRAVDTRSVKVQSPFVGRVKYSLGFSFDLALAHERRHLWQAWQVRNMLQRAA
jgi:hypothetical protein